MENNRSVPVVSQPNGELATKIFKRCTLIIIDEIVANNIIPPICYEDTAITLCDRISINYILSSHHFNSKIVVVYQGVTYDDIICAIIFDTAIKII